METDGVGVLDVNTYMEATGAEQTTLLAHLRMMMAEASHVESLCFFRMFIGALPQYVNAKESRAKIRMALNAMYRTLESNPVAKTRGDLRSFVIELQLTMKDMLLSQETTTASMEFVEELSRIKLLSRDDIVILIAAVIRRMTDGGLQMSAEVAARGIQVISQLQQMDGGAVKMRACEILYDI